MVCPHNLRRPYYEPLVWFMIYTACERLYPWLCSLFNNTIDIIMPIDSLMSMHRNKNPCINPCIVQGHHYVYRSDFNMDTTVPVQPNYGHHYICVYLSNHHMDNAIPIQPYYGHHYTSYLCVCPTTIWTPLNLTNHPMDTFVYVLTMLDTLLSTQPLYGHPYICPTTLYGHPFNYPATQ